MKRRIISLILAIILAVGLLPTAILAAPGGGGPGGGGPGGGGGGKPKPSQNNTISYFCTNQRLLADGSISKNVTTPQYVKDIAPSKEGYTFWKAVVLPNGSHQWSVNKNYGQNCSHGDRQCGSTDDHSGEGTEIDAVQYYQSGYWNGFYYYPKGESTPIQLQSNQQLVFYYKQNYVENSDYGNLAGVDWGEKSKDSITTGKAISVTFGLRNAAKNNSVIGEDRTLWFNSDDGDIKGIEAMLKPGYVVTKVEIYEGDRKTHEHTGSAIQSSYTLGREKSRTILFYIGKEENLKVTYDWKGLPDGATPQLPVDAKTYTKEDNKVTVDTTYSKNDIYTQDGVNYLFSGWYLDSKYKTPAGTEIEIQNSITLYGKWESPVAVVDLNQDVHVQKTLTGENPPDDGFAFTAQVKDNNDAVVSTGTVNMTGTGTENFTFNEKLTFNKAGEYTYTVAEVKENADNVTYDNATYTLYVTVTEEEIDGGINLKAAVYFTKPGETSITFTNKYEPAPSYTLTYDGNGGWFGTDTVTNKQEESLSKTDKHALNYTDDFTPEHEQQGENDVIFLGWSTVQQNVLSSDDFANADSAADGIINAVKIPETKVVYAVWALDENDNHIPDVFEATIIYKIVNGMWTDEDGNIVGNEDITATFALYKQQSDHTWKKTDYALKDGSFPIGRCGKEAGYTGLGWFRNKDTEPTELVHPNKKVTEVITGATTEFTCKYELAENTYTVVLHLAGGSYAEAPAGYTGNENTWQYTVEPTNTINPAEPARDGFDFKGWSLTDTTPQLIGSGKTFTELYFQQGGSLEGPWQIDLYAVWDRSAPTPNINLGDYIEKKFVSRNGSAEDEKFTVTATVYLDTEEAATAAGYVTLSTGETKRFSFDTIYLADGSYTVEVKETAGGNDRITYDTKTYTFTLEVAGNNSRVDNTVTITNYYEKPSPILPIIPAIIDRTPEKLNTDDHYAYVIGYPDGSVRPEGQITRAEVAAIFFRLLTDEVRDEYFTTYNSFTDVERGSWYNNPVSTMASLGIITGYPDGTFRPDAPITRAEFAAIAARFDENAVHVTAGFSDVDGHWAAKEIGVAYGNGWIKGYPDGTFRPNQNITRAEAMALINRVLNRNPETPDDLLDDMNRWTDNLDTTRWYYLDVQEATNSHDYHRKANDYETWVLMLRDPDWSRYER